MAQIPARPPKKEHIIKSKLRSGTQEIVALTPDFPFDYRTYLNLNGNAPIGEISDDYKDSYIAIIGAGVAGMITAYEAMRMGLRPIIFEAGDRIGGRFYSYKFDNGEIADPTKRPIAEMGAMRFSKYSRTIRHYFEKTRLWDNSADFPNPGSGIVPGNIVDYLGEQFYYTVDKDTGELKGDNPFTYLEDLFYGDGEPDSGLLERNGYRFSDAVRYQTVTKSEDGEIQPVPEEQQKQLKTHWNNLLYGRTTSKGESSDAKSFRDMLTDDNWTFDQIEQFGQIGFGTGGWAADYIDSSMELLRVLYMLQDTNQSLMFDGCDAMPNRLYTEKPSQLGDTVADGVLNRSLENLQAAEGDNIDGVPWDPRNKEVVGFEELPDGINVIYRETGTEEIHTYPVPFEAVVYTGHVRVLDKLRYQSSSLEMQQNTTNLFNGEMWEAIMYQHFQPSAKVFQAVDSPFWMEGDGVIDGVVQYQMSQTLSDRLTRGTYLVDYAESTGTNKGAGVYTTYTWQDDTLKFVASDNEKEFSSWLTMSVNCLNQIYDREDVFLGHAIGGADKSINWTEEPHFLCAFKYNLPGHYRYQRTLFQNFYCGPALAADVAPDTNRFIMAGDDIAWSAAWAEGAAQTALNAVSKLEYLFNGNKLNPLSPHGQYKKWIPADPVDIPG